MIIKNIVAIDIGKSVWEWEIDKKKFKLGPHG